MRHLVTGAGSGIGEALVDRLHERGDELLLLARSRSRADQLADRWPGCDLVVADLDRPEDLEAGWPETGRVDSLVHSAGVVGLGTVAELSVAEWQRQLTVNLVAVAEVTRLVLPALRAARGTVVCVNSGAGLRANPGWSAYAASKFGLRGFTDALRQEEREHGVRVTGVHPGRVATPMQERLHEQEGKDYRAEDWIQPSTVAEAILQVIDQPADACVDQVVLRPR